MMQADIEDGEHLENSLEGEDRWSWESSPDGENVVAEHIPSAETVTTRWARRIQKKFGVSLDNALLLSYCAGVICEWNAECLRHYEQELQKRGFPEVFSEVKHFALELVQLEPSDEIQAFSPGTRDYHPIPLVAEDEEPDWELALEELQEMDDVHPLLEAFLKREKNPDAFFKEHHITDFPLNLSQAHIIVDLLKENWIRREEARNKPSKKNKPYKGSALRLERQGLISSLPWEKTFCLVSRKKDQTVF